MKTARQWFRTVKAYEKVHDGPVSRRDAKRLKANYGDRFPSWWTVFNSGIWKE